MYYDQNVDGVGRIIRLARSIEIPWKRKKYFILGKLKHIDELTKGHIYEFSTLKE